MLSIDVIRHPSSAFHDCYIVHDTTPRPTPKRIPSRNLRAKVARRIKERQRERRALKTRSVTFSTTQHPRPRARACKAVGLAEATVGYGLGSGSWAKSEASSGGASADANTADADEGSGDALPQVRKRRPTSASSHSPLTHLRPNQPAKPQPPPQTSFLPRPLRSSLENPSSCGMPLAAWYQGGRLKDQVEPSKVAAFLNRQSALSQTQSHRSVAAPVGGSSAAAAKQSLAEGLLQTHTSLLAMKPRVALMIESFKQERADRQKEKQQTALYRTISRHPKPEKAPKLR